MSDKPVTLSFKGGLGQKIGFATSSASGPVKKPIALPSAFSTTAKEEEEERKREEEEAKAASQDLKGLSHLRCKRAFVRIGALTCREL